MVADVLVVGAGLAGLRCAVALTELGREVVVLEASDVVGGRVRTDVVNGFQCDRGFQVLNPAYPAVCRWVDVDALALQSFGAGVMVRRDDGLRVLADPFREPRLLPQTLRSGYLRPGEVAALGRWNLVVFFVVNAMSQVEAFTRDLPMYESRIRALTANPLVGGEVGAAGALARLA